METAEGLEIRLAPALARPQRLPLRFISEILFLDSCFPDSKYLRVLRGEEDCFGDDAAATDAKRRPRFQTFTRAACWPDSCYLCNPRFLRSSSFVPIRVD